MTFRNTFLLCLCFLGAASTANAGTPTEYTVSSRVSGPASLTGHGSILPPTQVVAAGGTSTVTIAPDPGYRVIAVAAGACSGVANGDGTWTIGPIEFDCEIDATFALDAGDVVFQSDLEDDVRHVADVGLDIPANMYGASINWETSATCFGAAGAFCDSTYHFRPASSLFVMAHQYLVFRFPSNDDDDLPGEAHNYGIVSAINTDDPDGPYPVSVPLLSGDIVGPAQTFDYPASIPGAAPWTSPDGVDAYIGFQFLDSVSGRINYGYAHLVTQPSTNGFPATLTDYAYNRRGDAIVIP